MTNNLNRRQALAVSAKMGAATVLGIDSSCAQPNDSQPNAAPTNTAVSEIPKITHGPMLGRPGARHMGIWVRTAQPGPFAVLYGKHPTDYQLLAEGITKREADNTGWVLLEKLDPDCRYYYSVAVGEQPSISGSFRTLPTAEPYRDEQTNPRGLFNFAFEITCCANQAGEGLGPSLPGYKTMLDRGVPDDVAFAILNGDWLYEEQRDYPVEAWLRQTQTPTDKIPALVKLVPPIVGVWENYKTYLHRGKNLAAWHRVVPSFYTFDDHELLNDVVGCAEVGRRDRRAVFRDPAIQGWYDYLGWSNPTAHDQPIHFGHATLRAGSDILEDPAADFTKLKLEQAATLHVHWGTPDAGVNLARLDNEPGDPNANVYEVAEVLDAHRLRVRPAAAQDGQQTYSIGRHSYGRKRIGNCDLFLLDTRTHRQKHDPTNPNAKKTMLGKQQIEWLQREMQASDADFFFVVSSVNLMIPHVGAGGMSPTADDKDDAWTAFPRERKLMIDFWDSLGKPVMVFTGDLHNSYSLRVTPRVWEFCVGPINSRNHPASAEGGRPANGPFDSLGHECEIRWSTYFLDETPRPQRQQPVYGIVQVNNVFGNPTEDGSRRWVVYPQPHVVMQFYSGFDGKLLYAEPVFHKMVR